MSRDESLVRRYFDTHLHLPSADHRGLDALRRHLDEEPEMVGGILILNTPADVEFVEARLGDLPDSLIVAPQFPLAGELPNSLIKHGWFKLHPRMQLIGAADVGRVVRTVATSPLRPKGLIVHCFPWGTELEFASSVGLVVALGIALPTTWILATHGGGYESWQLRSHAGSLRNVLFDFSLSLSYYERSDHLRPFQRYLIHSPDRLLFGSDWPSAQAASQLRECVRLAEECGVAEDQLMQLFLDNSKRYWPHI